MKPVYSLILVAALAVPVFAGDIQVPGKSEPPPPPPACTENCTQSATTGINDASIDLLDTILIVVGLIGIP